MAKDDRLYARLTLDFPDHPKVVVLSYEARWALIELIISSRKHLLDGCFPFASLECRYSAQIIAELCSNHPEKPSLSRAGDYYILHDVNDHQTTKAEVDDLRAARVVAGRQGGIASGEARRSKPKQVASKNRSKLLQKTRSKTKPETETETETEETSFDVAIATSSDVFVDETTQKNRGCRLPAGWQPPGDVIAQMRSEHPDVDLKLEHAKFVDYWHARTGQGATKRDWPATWRNWIRTAAENQTRNDTRNGISRGDAKILEWQKLGRRNTP